MNDAVVLLRDIGADAATNAAGKVRPDEEQLKRIDEPAKDNTWHENPDFSKENLKKQAQEKFNKNKPIDRQDLEDARARGEQQGDRKAGALEGAEVLKDRAKDGISEDKKDKARETRAKTKNYLDKKMPEERREQTIWRLKKIVVEVQSHSDCKSPWGSPEVVLANNSQTKMQSTPCWTSLRPMLVMLAIWDSRPHKPLKVPTLTTRWRLPKLTWRFEQLPIMTTNIS